ncbi:MAG TPA: ferrochelatase [Acidimicrobiaceae bacterium]|nr:ferrochelatase [Acidimicrobiaceae bacterium]|tara:strand:+ start:4217 stop:5233 length:1017 start_codon:yes stop_codon:yes gene_type:complete
MGMGRFDSLLLLSFGGPENSDDVMPFLRNVTAGRGVPDERLAVVAEQYELFGGKSPINELNQQLLSALDEELVSRGHEMATFWGNRNWHPFVTDTIADLKSLGHTSTVCLVTSAFSSYSGCRQYHEDLDRARNEVPGAPNIERVRVYWDHPDFLGTAAELLAESRDAAGLSSETPVLHSAHSLPLSMAANCDYQQQLNEAASIVNELAGMRGPYEVVFQSRSGPPSVPWLTPDIDQRIHELAEQGTQELLVHPLGFVADHMEVLFDLDTQSAAAAKEADVKMVRTPTVGTHPRFVSMLVDLVEEAAGLRADRPSLSKSGPRPDKCNSQCCPAPIRPGR